MHTARDHPEPTSPSPAGSDAAGELESALPLRWRTIILAFFLATIAVIAWWSVIEPIYFTNDDVTFRLAISGEDIPGEPASPFLLSIHPALTYTAIAIQQAVPLLPVWDFVLLTTLLLGLAVLAAIVWNAHPGSRARRIIDVAALLTVVVPISIGLQFTISAVLCGGAAALLAMSELDRTSAPRYLVLVAAGALLVVGLLVRPMGAEAGALATAVLYGARVITGVEWRRRVMRMAIAVAGMLALFAIVNVTDGALYPERGGWAEYRRYHGRNIGLIEWGGAATSVQENAILTATGWTNNDWQALQEKWATDAERFGFDQMRSAAAAAKAAGAEDSMIGRLLARGIEWQDLEGVWFQIAPACLLALILAGSLATFRGAMAAALMVALFVGICAAIQAGYKEVPFRLLAPLQVCLMAVVVGAIAEHRRPFSAVRIIVALLVSVAAVGEQTRLAVAQATADEDQGRSVRRQVNELLALQPSLVIIHSDSFPAEHWWRPFQRPVRRLPMIKLQRNNQDPRLQHFLIATGRSHLFRSICGDPSVLLIANANDLSIPSRYLSEHEGVEATWSQVFDGTFRVWRCSAATTSGDEAQGPVSSNQP